MKRTYLLTVFIAAASQEHFRLREKALALSNGELEFVHASAGSIAIAFNSTEAFDTIGRAFESVTMSTDRFLLAELGPRTWTYQLNGTRNWMAAHHTGKGHSAAKK